MAASASLQIFFSLDPAQRPVSKPLLFHHIPGSTGLAFRNALSRFLEEAGDGGFEVPKVRTGLKAAGEWPTGIPSLFENLSKVVCVDAVFSHYTALLAEITPAPILSLMRDPEEYFLAAVIHRSRRLTDTLNRTGSIRETIVNHDLTNPQMHTLRRIKIPNDPPQSASGMRRWADIVDQIVQRFTLFRAVDYDAFVNHCRREYGTPAIGPAEKDKRLSQDANALLVEVQSLMNDRDPIWLDRMLYERIAAQRA